MRIKQMTNAQLVEELSTAAAKEATWTPKGNGVGRKSFQALTDRRARLEQEILRRLGVNSAN